MAIFHYRCDRITRSGGRSAVGAAAYHKYEKFHNEYDGISHDYTNRRGAIGAAAYHKGQALDEHDFTQKSGIIHTEVMLPEHAPREFMDSEKLWNSVEKFEKRHDAQTARIIVVALPAEMNTEQHIKLLREHIQENFVDEGMCADFSIHSGHIHSKKDDEYPFQDLAIQKDNPHAHIQLTVRPLNPDGSWGSKTQKEYILDKNGDKINLESGKGWKSRNIPLTDWEKPETLLKWREDWANTVNREFERMGLDERIDHRTLAAQGIDREPTKHMGHEAWNLERKGTKTEIGDINRGIMERNKERKPEKVAEYMNKLQDGYKVIDKNIEEYAQNQRAIKVLNEKAAEMERRAIEITRKREELAEALQERENMKFWQSKRDINNHIAQLENAESSARKAFAQRFGAEFDNVSGEIEKMESQKAAISKKFQGVDMEQLADEKKKIVTEYNKQRIIADIRPDGKEIFDRLHKAPPLMERLTDETRREIIQELTPIQARILAEKREKEQEEKRRIYERTR